MGGVVWCASFLAHGLSTNNVSGLTVKNQISSIDFNVFSVKSHVSVIYTDHDQGS